jgi:hypothetical protein
VSYAVTLELYHRGQDTVTFDSIETSLSLTMSRELYEAQGSPATVVVLVPDLTPAAALSHDAEPVGHPKERDDG